MMSSIIRDYSEKRDFIRMKVDAEINLLFDNPTKEITGICRDLSGTGMLIEVEEQVEEGKTFQTKLPSSNDAFPPFNATVAVKRCSPTERETWLLGTEITEIHK